MSGSGAHAGFVAFHNTPIFATDCTTVRAHPTDSKTTFIYHALKHNEGVLYNIRSGSAQPHVYPRDIAALPILLPPLPEQRRIAAVLDAIDDAIERTNDVIAATEQLRDALLHDLLSNEVSGWRFLALAEAPIEIIDGDRGEHYPKQHDFLDSGYCLFLNTGNVTTDGFNFSSCVFISYDREQQLKKGKLVRGDVVLTTRGTVGNSAHFDDTVPYEHIRVNSGMVILRASSIDLSPRYLYALVRSQTFLSQVHSLRIGSAQPQLPIRVMEKITLPLPPLPEQQTIAAMIETVDKAIARECDEHDVLQSLKESTADALLTGRVRI